jgi:hypothetical protein
MDPEAAARAADPFFTTRTTRRVGLGLPLLAEAARAAGGGLKIESRRGEGSRITASFRHGHIDRAPLGDIETTIMVLMAGNPDLAFRFEHRLGSRQYAIDTEELRRAGIDLWLPEGLGALRKVIRKGESDLRRAS